MDRPEAVNKKLKKIFIVTQKHKSLTFYQS